VYAASQHDAHPADTPPGSQPGGVFAVLRLFRPRVRDERGV